MTDENSPLNPENIEAAKKKAEEVGKKAVAYARSIANGNASIRVAALLGGVLLCADSITAFFKNLLSLNLINALINFYAFLVGASAIVMESDRDAIPYATRLRSILGKNFGIVRTVTGRGLFYGIAATLELSQVRNCWIW
jgi:COPI associated protein.